ncbi:MAG: VOC family protein [Bacteroidota bacterium]
MRRLLYVLLLVSILISSCTQEQNSAISDFSIYCEMVANDAKPVALHYPMESDAIDQLWDEFNQVARKYEVKLHREDDFPISRLFPGKLTEGKTVVLIYKGDRLVQYNQWQVDLLSSDGNDRQAEETLARRFGRLLGYTPQGINQLLIKNWDYRNLTFFGVQQQLTHLYYDNLEDAVSFYSGTLGLQQIDSSTFKIGKDAIITLHSTSDEHPAGQPKSTAIAFLTDQLPEWYDYIQKQNVPIKYTYKPRNDGPHDGFVAIDPGGYLLEFEQFKQHPENELFMAILDQAPRLETGINKLNFYGSITWTYHKDLLLMQKFYEEVLGYRLVADQGWTKIYQTTDSGFIGLVDERRGMEDYAETKAVEIEWQVIDLDSLKSYAGQFWEQYNSELSVLEGPENYIYRLSMTK